MPGRGSPPGGPPVKVRFASVDTTRQCPLRCQHCFYYQVPPKGPDLAEESFLRSLAEWKKQTGVDCMLWLGGEPLLRPRLVREGGRLFRRNAAFTSGMLPIPDDLGCGMMVSLEGPASVNDGLRGGGTFDRVMANTRRGEGRLFHCTLTPGNLGSARGLVDLLRRGNAAGLIFGLYSPRIGEHGGNVLEGTERDRAVEEVRAMKREYGDFILNTEPMLDRMSSKLVPGTSAMCPYRTGEAIALDHRLRPKSPCSYGAGADCSRCGCVALFLRSAALGGDARSRAVLEAFFLAR